MRFSLQSVVRLRSALAATSRERVALAPWVGAMHASTKSRVASSAELASAHAGQAFGAENASLSAHGALFNQTTPQSLLELADVEPMMGIYEKLSGVGALTPSATVDVARALCRSAKDCTLVFRRLPTREKREWSLRVFASLERFCDRLANDILEGTAPADLRALGTLISAYEVVNPQKGVQFFEALGNLNVTGSAIPCMVKANVPLDVITLAYEAAPKKHDRLMANMVWALLKYDRVDEAVALERSMYDPPEPVRQFLTDVFIGDAPLATAKNWFATTDLMPNSSAMGRFLARAWRENPDVQDQVSLFRRYLELSRGSSESHIKTVTYQLINNVLEGIGANVDESFDVVLGELAQAYAGFHEHTIFLNILLTQVSKKWPTDTERILQIFREYGVETSPVSYRVRLNALEQLDFPDKASVIFDLWNGRKGLPVPLDVYDWIALAKASTGTNTFAHEWNSADQPFKNKLRRFLWSRSIDS